jgi:hypothetical protein
MVLTDYCMPEMTGYDLLKAIKVTTHINKALQFLCHLCGFICAFHARRLTLSWAFSGVESPKADTSNRHVVRRRAPAD